MATLKEIMDRKRMLAVKRTRQTSVDTRQKHPSVDSVTRAGENAPVLKKSAKVQRLNREAQKRALERRRRADSDKVIERLKSIFTK